MALNKKEIFKALSKRPLCHGTLIADRGLAREYCAMGALAADVGATDEYLKQSDGNGCGIWRDFGDKLQQKFGIESLEQFQSLMHTNDAEVSAARRNQAVYDKVEALSPDEVNEIMAENTERFADSDIRGSRER